MIPVTDPISLGNGATVVNNGNVSGTAFPDLRKAFRQLFTLVGATYVGAPIGTPSPGSTIFLDFTQDGTGSQVITWDPIYRDAPSWGGAGAAGANAAGEFRFTSQGAWQYVGGSSAWAVQGEGLPGVTGSMALGGAAPTVQPGGVVVKPTVGALTVTGIASTRTVQANTGMTPLVGTLSAAGLAPTLAPLAPSAGAVAIAGGVPGLH